MYLCKTNLWDEDKQFRSRLLQLKTLIELPFTWPRRLTLQVFLQKNQISLPIYELWEFIPIPNSLNSVQFCFEIDNFGLFVHQSYQFVQDSICNHMLAWRGALYWAPGGNPNLKHHFDLAVNICVDIYISDKYVSD